MEHIRTLKSKIIPPIAAAALALGGAGVAICARRHIGQGRWQDSPDLNQDPVNTRRGRGLKKTREIKVRDTKSGMVRATEKAMARGTDPGRDLTSIT